MWRIWVADDFTLIGSFREGRIVYADDHRHPTTPMARAHESGARSEAWFQRPKLPTKLQ